MTRVLLMQRVLSHYRVAVFAALGSRRDIDLTVAHSGAWTPIQDAKFTEVKLTERRFGPFYWQRSINRLWEKYDVIIAPLDPASLSNVVAASRWRKRVLWWGHGLGRSKLANRVRMLLVRRAAGAVLYSEKGRRQLVEAGLPLERSFVAPNTVHIPNSAFLSDPRTDFVYVGRLQTRKELGEIIRAFKIIEKDLPTAVKVVFIGDGNVRKELETLVDSLSLGSRVVFKLGTHDHSELQRTFGSALAYVSPGHVGLGVLHAFAYGIPVVTRSGHERHAPEFENIISGFNGLLYEGRIEDLAAIMRRLASEHLLSETLGRNAYACYSQSRTLEHMLDGFEKAILYANSSSKAIR